MDHNFDISMLCLSKRHIFGQKFIFWHFDLQFIIRIIGIIVTYKRSKIYKTNSQSQQIKTKKKWRNETYRRQNLSKAQENDELPTNI